MTNPLLTELNNLSPGAKAALAAAHGAATSAAAAQPPKLLTDPSAAQLPPAIGAHPSMPPMGGPATPPPTPANITPPAPMPSALSAAPTVAPISAPRGTTAGDTNELGRVVGSGSGISQIHSKIENSNFGQNHPLLGKILGWGAQIPATLADVAGSAVAPSITANIPGTEYHHDRLIREDQRQLAGDTANQEKEAQTGEANARTADLENPPDEITPIATDQGYLGLSKKTGQANPIIENGQQVQPVDKPQAQNVHVLPDGKVVAISAGPDGQPTAKVVYQGDPAVKTEVKQLEVAGRPHQVLVNSQTGETIKDLGETGEKPPVVNVNADRRQKDAATEREYSSAAKDLNTQFSTAQTQIEAAQEAQSLINSGQVGQALGQVKTLVAIAGGKGSGVRITQAELNSFARGRGIQGDFDGWLNSLSGKGTLTGQQMRQINGVLQDAQGKLGQKRQVLSDTLDRLGDAQSPQEIRQIQSDFRHQTISETSGGGSSSGKAVSLKAAMALPMNKGKSEADVRTDIESHGHQVTD